MAKKYRKQCGHGVTSRFVVTKDLLKEDWCKVCFRYTLVEEIEEFKVYCMDCKYTRYLGAQALLSVEIRASAHSVKCRGHRVVIEDGKGNILDQKHVSPQPSLFDDDVPF